MLLDQVAAHPVDEHKRRLHRRQVQFGAAEIRMRFDAAIGDCQRSAIRHQQHFVRVHAVRRKLADPPEPVRRVIDADHPAGVVEVVFSGVEQLAVRRKDTVTEEVPSLDACNGKWFLILRMIEYDSESPRPPGKNHRALRHWIERNVVATVRQVGGKHDFAVFRQYRNAVGPIAALIGSGENGIGGFDCSESLWRKRRHEPCAGGLQEEAAVDEAHAQSPSSEEKPAVRPSSAESRVPKISDRLDVTTPK
jgi:hypothetical protein